MSIWSKQYGAPEWLKQSWPRIATVTEWTLIVLAAVLVTLNPFRYGSLLNFISEASSDLARFSWFALGAYLSDHWELFVSAIPLAYALLLPRAVRRPGWVLVLGTVGVVSFYGLAFWVREWQRIQDIYGPHDGPPFGLPVPDVVLLAMDMLCVLIPLVAGVLASRGMRSFWRFAVAWSIAALVVWIASGGLIGDRAPKMHWHRAMLSFLCLLAVPVLMWLPGQRAALREMLSRLEGWGRGAMVSVSLVAGGFLALYLCVAGAFALRVYEMNEILKGNLDLPPMPPGAVNGRDALAELFTRTTSPQILAGVQVPKTFGSSVQDQEVLSEEDVHFVEQMEEHFALYIAALVNASDSDYLRFRTRDAPAEPSFLNLRETARFVRLRCMLHTDRGEFDEALSDAKVLIDFAALLNSDDSGSLVTQMIGTAIRGIGTRCLDYMYRHTRNDPAAAEKLRQYMEADQQKLHVPLSWATLKETEPAFWSFVPYYNISVPGLGRAVLIVYRYWSTADSLRLAAALDAYCRKHGEYPETLGALVPEFFSRVPMDPETGGAYGYRREGDGFVIERMVHTRKGELGNLHLEMPGLDAKRNGS